MKTLRIWLRLVSVAMVSMLATYQSIAIADSWSLPTTTQYYSADEGVRFTVVPRDLESQLAYFEDKVAGREPAGPESASGPLKAQGTLEKLGVDGSWQLIWQRELSNEVAPVDVAVSEEGRYIVTFDNWHSTGYGENVVVIYGEDGELIRSLSLEDFLSESHIEGLPHSVSSIQWRGEYRFTDDLKRLVIDVLEPGQRPYDEAAKHKAVEIDLATGGVLESGTEHTSLEILGGGLAILLGVGAAVFATKKRSRKHLSQ